MANTTLRISTVLGEQKPSGDEGPLLLATIQGIEGISMPFAYDVTLLQSLDAPDIDPSRLLNTPAAIGMRGKTDTYYWRCGVFQYFEKDETNQRIWLNGFERHFRKFQARIVPVIRMMDLEVSWRVFENMTALEIINELVDRFPNSGGASHYLSTANLKTKDLPVIPYCVQFGESSFNFLSRLMAQFDIWYTFEHPQTGKSGTETMVLGNDPVPFAPCARAEMDITPALPKLDEIAGFQRGFQPARKRIWVGDFNMLQPASPPRGDSAIKPNYDMLPKTAADRFTREYFPATFADPRASTDAMSDQAKNRMEDEEENVFNVQGQSKNPSFMAGQRFHIRKDLTEAHSNNIGVAKNNQYLITKNAFTAAEAAYGHHWYLDALNFITSPVRWVINLFRGENREQMAYLDPPASLAAAGLGNYVQNETAARLASDTRTGDTYVAAGASIGAGMTGGLVQAVSTLAVASVKDIAHDHFDSYANSFTAVPWDTSAFSLIPGPDGVKPRAWGPHLAIVVGREGLGGKTDHYADALGRVRVRFPWQREVPKKTPADLIDPLKSDRRTAWVPVCEGWSGQGFGTQFVPRIGHQVLVSFIDGDPDRPIVTGRVYGAGMPSNLPFLAPVKLQTMNDLPATANENIPFSGIQTRSAPRPRDKNGMPVGKTGYHLLRFDDTYQDEQLLLRSQARMDITAKQSLYETIEGNRNILVTPGKDKDGDTTGGANVVTVGGEYDLHVGGDRLEAVDKAYQLSVKADTQFDLKGNWITVAGGNISLNAAEIVVEAGCKLTLKVGGSSVVLNSGGIWFDGPMHYEQCGGAPGKASNAQIKQVLDATKADFGEPPWERAASAGGGGGGGGRRVTTVWAQHGCNCSIDEDNKVCVDLSLLCHAAGGGD